MRRDDPSTDPPPALRLALARSPLLLRAGAPAVPIAPRDGALLAWLALEGPTPRIRLAELLWPDSAATAARNSLRQRLFKLKALCGIDLVTGGAVLGLAESVEHDLLDADSVLADAGEAFNGELGHWLAQQRERRRARLRESLVELAGMAERAGDWPDALVHANELLAVEPLSEEAHRRVMRLHYLAGDRAGALLAFDRCERVLKNEVGTRPSAETLALLGTVEAEMPTAGRAVVPAQGVPAGMLRPPRLIGRAAELATAAQAWRDGRVFLVEGEAGMGKSRLLQELLSARPATLAVQARPGDAVVPYATLVRLLRAVLERLPPDRDRPARQALAPVLPELGGAVRLAQIADAGQRFALGAAVADMVAGAFAAGIEALVVDDLHFADEASLEMLLQLARSDAPGPAWAFARRPAEGPPALAALHDALLEEQRLEPIVLAPLTQPQLVELLQALALPAAQVDALAATLHQHSGGNPLFALETLRQAWVDDRLGGDRLDGGRLPRPVSVTRLIARRVERLSPAAMRLARCAAVAGADFGIELAAAVLAAPAIDLTDAWSELEQAHVFVAGAFAHDLIQEVVHAGLPPPIARHLHGEVARHLEQRGAAPAAIARHHLESGTPARALPFLHRAGELAAQQRRFGEAASTFEQECRLCLAQGDRVGAFDAALRMRGVCFELDLAARTDVALELLAQSAVSAAQQARACAERALVGMHRGAMAEAEQAALAGLEALGSLDEPMLRADLHQHLAAVRTWQLRTLEAEQLLRAVEPDVEAQGTPARRFEFAQGMAIVQGHLDRVADAAHWHRRAADTALAAGLLPGAAQTLLNLAIEYRDSGRLDAALATLQEAQALLASLPEGAIPYSSLDLNFGIVQRDLGAYGEALDWFDRAVERGRIHTPGWVPLFFSQRAQLWLLLGQFARAQQDLDAADVDAAPALARARREWVLGQLQLQLHAGPEASSAFERAGALLGTGARALHRHRVVLAQCPALDPAEALAAAGDVLDAATAAQRLGLMTAARTRICQALLALGHGAEAARHGRQLATFVPGASADELYGAEVWLTAQRALAPVDAPRAAVLLATAVKWVRETAERQVPAEFRAGFLHRNPVNRELLALAARLPAGE